MSIAALPFFFKAKVLRMFNSRGVLGGGFKYLLFSPLLGEDSHFD